MHCHPAHTHQAGTESLSAAVCRRFRPAQQTKVKYVNMKTEGWRQVHLEPVIWWCTNKTLTGQQKTRTVKNSYDSYLSGADSFSSVVVAKSTKNAERQRAAGLLFCPDRSIINTKEEREEADRMVCKLTRGIYWADYSRTKRRTGRDENMDFIDGLYWEASFRSQRSDGLN